PVCRRGRSSLLLAWRRFRRVYDAIPTLCVTQTQQQCLNRVSGGYGSRSEPVCDPGNGLSGPGEGMRNHMTQQLPAREITTEVTTQMPPAAPPTTHRRHFGRRLSLLLRTTDPKLIGEMYVVTALSFFMAGGLMAMLMRAELARRGIEVRSPEQYNQLFTIHGTLMLLLYATPIVFGFANLVLPIQIGAPDVAFPRLNAFSFYLFLFGGLIVVSAFVVPNGPPAFGWTGYTPLSNSVNSP